jgi:hypothetical protein
MAALLTSGSFPASVVAAQPVGAAATPPNAQDPVQLTLSDGSVTTVFDSVATAMKCLEWMRLQGMQQLYPSTSVVVLNVAGTKLLVLETTPGNLTLRSRYVPFYSGGRLAFAHVSLGLVHDLASALRACGVCVAGPLATNADLTPLGCVLVDWNYSSSKAATSLTDTVPLQYLPPAVREYV